MTRRYVVIGAGGVGAALAAGLDEAGIPAVLVSRGATYDAIRARGLRYTHAGRERVLRVDVAGSPDDVRLTPDDVLVLAVKTQDATAALAAWARRPVGDGLAGDLLPVVTLQNGLEAERVALRHFARVVSGTTLIAARHIEPGAVQVLNAPKAGQIILGPEPSAAASPDTARLVAGIAEHFRAAGWLVHEADEPHRWKAWKLLASATFPVDVLAGDDTERKKLRALLRDEAREVLEAAGYEFAAEAELSYDRSLAAIDPGAGFVPGQLSTWQSFARGAGSEADHLTGEVVLQARLQGRDAPVSRAVQSALAAAEAAGEGPGIRRTADVLDAADAARRDEQGNEHEKETQPA